MASSPRGWVLQRAIVGAARKMNSQGLVKEVMANGMRLTGKEVMNTALSHGLAKAATGAVVGGGYGLISGGSMWEGAKQGAMIGGAWGTYSGLNTRRMRAAAAFGMADKARGFGGGFRATAEIAGLPKRDLIQAAQQTQVQSKAHLRSALDAARRLESGALNSKTAQGVMGDLRKSISDLDQLNPGFSGASESAIEELAARLNL